MSPKQAETVQKLRASGWKLVMSVAPFPVKMTKSGVKIEITVFPDGTFMPPLDVD